MSIKLTREGEIAIIVFVVSAIGTLTLLGGLVFVAYHFIAKFW